MRCLPGNKRLSPGVDLRGFASPLPMTILPVVLIIFFLATVSCAGVLDEVYTFLRDSCRQTRITPQTYWKNPTGTIPFARENNGWTGMCALQPLVIAYEATSEKKYLDFARHYGYWLKDQSIWAKNGTLCRTKENRKPPFLANAQDDAAWMVLGFCELFSLTQDRDFLDHAVRLFFHADREWGNRAGLVGPAKDRKPSRGLYYQNNAAGRNNSSYMTAMIVAGLELFLLQQERDSIAAAGCLTLACRYYNYFEYAHRSNGRDGRKKGIYGGPRAYLVMRDMWMAVANQMLQVISDSGTRLGPYIPAEVLADGPGRRAVETARAIVTVKSVGVADGYCEASPHGPVLINAQDPNVNAFPMRWWCTYIVPLDPVAFGGPVMNTAARLLELYGTRASIRSCWNASQPDPLRHPKYASPREVYTCKGSFSRCYLGGPELAVHAMGATLLAAAAYIEKASTDTMAKGQKGNGSPDDTLSGTKSTLEGE